MQQGTMPKRNEEHWSFAALRKRLSEKTQIIIPPPEDYKEGEPNVLRTTITPDWEGGTVFLFDPALERQLDADFYRVLYPVVSEVFENEPFQIPAIDEIKLTGNRSFGEAARSAMFSTQDPTRRPGTEERPWWSVVFNLDVREPGYHIGTSLSVFLPYYVE